jgi:membrane protease YdiL (CAAX protease family)
VNELPDQQGPPEVPVFEKPVEPQVTGLQMSVGAALALAASGILYLVMFIVGGEFRTFAVTGLFAIPFMILVVLAYSTESRPRWTRFLTFGYWMMLTGGMGFLAMMLTFAVIALPTLGPLTDLNAAQTKPANIDFSMEQGLRMLAAFVALVGAGIISMVCFLPAVRRKFAQFIDISPQSFVHATALATLFAILLMSLIPLLAVGGPPAMPLLELQLNAADAPDAGEQLRTTFYSFVWALPGTFLAVGYPLKRHTLREARQRLGLVRPTLRQLALAVVMTGALLLVMPLMGYGVEFLWKTLGWPLTDEESIKQLFGFTAGLVGATVAAVVAGLGEELVFRGVLQPRLGIVLPALMFTAVHALQYNFDALLQVFFLGVVFGLIRKRTNTTTSALIHGGYDFVLLLTMNGA